jgi:hypothetical protein
VRRNSNEVEPAFIRFTSIFHPLGSNIIDLAQSSSQVFYNFRFLVSRDKLEMAAGFDSVFIFAVQTSTQTYCPNC